jgi:hypothetical protein
MPCKDLCGGRNNRLTGDTRTPAETVLRRDARGEIREDNRVNPSIYRLIAQFLIGNFHQ